MRSVLCALLVMASLPVSVRGADASADRPGTEEFGLTRKELVENIEKVEAHIAKCMREQGFEYVAADYKTVRSGVVSDKSLPGMDEEEFIEEYGYGIATLYTGQPPQLNDNYSPARIGLGRQNVEVFRNLSSADQVAYNRALLGDPNGPTFAVALEQENFSKCGGCTLKAVKEVFKPEQMQSSYVNPLTALIDKDPRMRVALRKYAEKMRAAGYDYNHPDEVEPDIQRRLDAILGGGMPPVDKLSSDQRVALKNLQEFERKVTKVNAKYQEELFEPIEDQIEKEMYAREVK
jgi:hypothetical protein